ncbi:MAG: TolC family protein, partial [Roseibacillus sp.]
LQAVRTPPLPSRTTSAVLRHRPDLLAAEARVRSAFQLEESSRLNLLPSLALGAGASGQSSALAAGFRQWIASVGPRLDIPVYDPRRLAAVRVRREVTALDEARQNTLALFEGGIVSQIELLESERRSLEGRRQELAVRHALLRDHLALVKALGGAQ